MDQMTSLELLELARRKLKQKRCKHDPLVTRLRREVDEAGRSWYYGDTICVKCEVPLEVLGDLGKAFIKE